MLTDLQMDDVVRLRKPHPCGSSDWVVVRLGADIVAMFKHRCAQLDTTPSQVLRRLVMQWLEDFDNHKRERK